MERVEQHDLRKYGLIPTDWARYSRDRCPREFDKPALIRTDGAEEFIVKRGAVCSACSKWTGAAGVPAGGALAAMADVIP